jgi:hypothetical protein
MSKSQIIVLVLILGFVYCKNSNQEIDRLEIAKQFYEVLNNSDASKMKYLVADSIIIRENEYDYQETFSSNGYVEWLKWDSVFGPTYEVLEIEKDNGNVKAKISKIDKRITFLHNEPIVTNEVIHFDKGKIIKVEKAQYLIFKERFFVKNRDTLVSWIDKNHPELSGFINDQTEIGGKKYLKAIALYKNRE